MFNQTVCDTPGVPREPKFRGDYTFNTGAVKHVTAVDMAVFAFSLVVPTLVGIYQAWRSSLNMSFEDYMLAKGRMGCVPVGCSLVASFLSAITILGGPVEVYYHNTMNAWVGFAFVMVCALCSQIFLPVFYELRVKSVYQYLEMRFSRTVRTAAFCIFLVHMIFYMALVLYIPSLALSRVTGVHLWGSIVTITLVCILYVTIGGIKAVIWSDCFHMILMLVTLTFTLICAASVINTKYMVEYGIRTNRLRFFDFRLDPRIRNTTWGSFFGGGSSFLSLFAVHQVAVHRCLTCRTLKEAKISVWICFPGFLVFFLLTSAVGLYMSAFFENCDPMTAKLVDRANMLTPLFMQDIMGSTPGFMGIYLAGVFSATLSTVSSVINSVAMVFLEDCIRVHCEVRHKSRKRRLFSQIFTVIFGVVCMEIAYLVSRIGDPVLETGVTNHACMAGTLLGVFSLGMFFPWANETGALFGMFGAMAITLSMFFGLPKAPNTEVPLTCVTNCNISALSNISRIALLKPRPTIIVPTEIPDKLYCVSYIWLSVISSGSCFIIGIIVSYITGFKKPTDLDPRLIVPLLDVMFPFYYLPENIREYFRFGINHENKYEETRKKRRFSASESTVGSHLTPHGTADVYSERSYVRSEIKSARSMKESGSNRSYLGTGTSIVESEV